VRRPEALDSELPAALSFSKKPAQRATAREPAQPVRERDASASQNSPTQPAPPPSRVDDFELPELAKEPPLVKPISMPVSPMVSDLPMPGLPAPRVQPEKFREFDIDLKLPPAHEMLPAATQGRNQSDDLEIDLPSPFDAGRQQNRQAPLGNLDFDLDLPSPSLAPAGGRSLDNLPSVAPRRSPATTKENTAFGEIDIASGSEFAFGSSPSDAPSDDLAGEIAFIPDLDASLAAEKKPTTASAGAAASRQDMQAGLLMPDLTDALPMDSGPPGPGQSSTPPPNALKGELGATAARRSLAGEVGVMAGQGTATRVNAGALSRTSGGGGTDFGEVNLDIGSGIENAIATIDDESRPRDRQISADLEFGAIPQEAAAKAATAADVSGNAAAQTAQVQRKRPDATPVATKTHSRKALRFVLLGSLVSLVVGGAALSLLPDVGLFGSAYISDQLRKSEYDRLLAAQASAVQRALAQDLHPEAIRALQQLEAAQKAHPRARNLKAYLAFVAYAIDLRFGPSPERNSKAKVLLSQLATRSDIEHLELAQAARAADERNLARAHQRIDDLRRANPRRIEVQVLSAQIEMLDRRPGQSLVYWREVERVEHSARSAFGSAAAELAMGQTDASEHSVKAALERQPRHIGGRLLMARIAMDKRGDSVAAEKMLAEAQASAADASPAELVSMHTMLGDLAMSRSRISAAETAYAKALASDPRCSGALRGLGEALYRTGRFSEALARFEAAVQADPDDSTAAVGVAKSLLSLERVRDAVALLSKLLATHAQSFLVNYWYGAALEAVGNREEAEKAFTKAVQLGGNEPAAIDAYVSLALLKNQQGRREEAQKLLDVARAKLPLSAKLLVAIGQLALSEGRYEAAIADFRRALELEPTDIAARFRLGVALRKHRKFDEAMTCFEDVAKVDAGFPGLALERGLLYETSGRTDEALKAFEDALSKAPNDPDLMLRVGCGKVAAGRPKEAESLLRKVLDQRPMSAETHHCLGRAQLLEGTNLGQALRTLERAAELDPYRPEYYLYVGWAANEAGRIGTAEQALKKAIALDQGLGDAYWQRGVLRFRQGAVKDAVVDLTKAIELRPSRFEAHAALAEAFYELGMEVKALEHWRIASQAQPENAAWHFSYGKLLQAINRDADARTELEQALQLGEKLEPAPRWIWEAHRLLAKSLGLQPAAIPHWQAYLRLSPLDHAYRDEAKQALSRLGQPWQGG
jgi:tetratricopeptide (TPR) repeat protein